MSTHDLSHWEPRELPGQSAMAGEHVRVEPMHDARRFAELHEVFEGHDRLWDYLAYGPFETAEAFGRFANANYLGSDPMFHAIVPASSNRAEGVAALMRIDPANGVIEIGHICLSPGLQQTPAATQAFALLFSRVFDELGYRRLEWKCNDQNMPSKRAAARLGFTFEGVFRQHMVTKGRNRDTAWFSIVDAEWPKVKAGFDAWLQPENFDVRGRQRRSLSQLRP